jgi:hypothetical protein
VIDPSMSLRLLRELGREIRTLDGTAVYRA